MNAYHASVIHGWRYCEGKAVSYSLPLPLDHAWCLDEDGQVIETTWLEVADEYFGVVFKD